MGQRAQSRPLLGDARPAAYLICAGALLETRRERGHYSRPRRARCRSRKRRAAPLELSVFMYTTGRGNRHWGFVEAVMLGRKQAVMKKRCRVPFESATHGVSCRGGAPTRSEHRNRTHRQAGSLRPETPSTRPRRANDGRGTLETVVSTGGDGENLDGGLLGEVLVVAAPLELGALRRFQGQDVRLLVRHALPRRLQVAAQLVETGRF